MLRLDPAPEFRAWLEDRGVLRGRRLLAAGAARPSTVALRWAMGQQGVTTRYYVITHHGTAVW